MALLEELMPAGLRFAFGIFKSIAEKEVSANEVLRQAAEIGISFRRTDALALVRAIRDEASIASYIKSVRNEFLPNPARFAPSLTNLLRSFSYTVEARGKDINTGESVVRHLTVSTWDLLTKNQVMGIADSYIAQGEKSGQVTDYELVVTQAKAQAGMTF